MHIRSHTPPVHVYLILGNHFFEDTPHEHVYSIFNINVLFLDAPFKHAHLFQIKLNPYIR